MNVIRENAKAFNPYSLFRRVWEYIMFFMSVLCLFELPFEWIFDIPLTTAWVLPALAMDAIFAVDIYISQNTGIMEFGVINLDTNYIHSKIPLVRKIIYWISPIPIYLIGFFVHSLKVYRILLIYKLIRVVRLATAISTMRTSLIYISSFSKMIILFTFLFLTDHIFACIFWFVGYEELPGPSWLNEVAAIQDERQFIQYIHTFYYITTTILTIGYGDIHPYTFREIVVIIVVECVGVFFYNFFVSNMVSIVADPSRNSFLEKYQKVYSAFRWRGVSDDSILELLRYYEYVWERDHDEADFYDNARRLPESLKEKIALALHTQLFANIDFIKGMSKECRGQLAMRLRPRIFTPGDYLIKAGSVSKKIYFLSSGKVEVLSSCGSLINSYEGPAKIIFGISSFTNGTEEVTCVIAQTYVETYELTKSDFDEVKELVEDFKVSTVRNRLSLVPSASNFNSHQAPRISQLPDLPNINLASHQSATPGVIRLSRFNESQGMFNIHRNQPPLIPNVGTATSSHGHGDISSFPSHSGLNTADPMQKVHPLPPLPPLPSFSTRRMNPSASTGGRIRLADMANIAGMNEKDYQTSPLAREAASNQPTIADIIRQARLNQNMPQQLPQNNEGHHETESENAFTASTSITANDNKSGNNVSTYHLHSSSDDSDDGDIPPP